VKENHPLNNKILIAMSGGVDTGVAFSLVMRHYDEMM